MHVDIHENSMERTHANGVGIAPELMQIGARHHWPTYYTQLADLLHTIGRLITRHWPTYYTPLADLLHTPWTHEATHCGDVAGSPGVPGNRRGILATSSTDLGSAGRLMTWHGRLITRGGQAGARRGPDWVGGWALVN